MRSTSQKQEQDVYLQSFPSESQSTKNPAPPGGIARDKATEVALLAFPSESNDSPRPITDSPESPVPPVRPAPAPIFLTPDGPGWGSPLAARRWALAAVVCGVAAAAVATFTPAPVPAKSLPPAVARIAADAGGAATSTSNEAAVAPTVAPAAPTVVPAAPTVAPAAEPAPTAVTRAEMVPRPDRTVGSTGREAVGRNRGVADLPSSTPTAAPQSTAVSGFSGSLAVSSSPEGATVFVNGVAVGATPLVLHDVAVGSRAVRLELPGHERWSSAVRIIASEETRVIVQLRPSPAR
jgi:hypothetical protein